MTTTNYSDNRRILVVEDDPMIGGLIAEILEEEGFEPLVVRDGREALRTFHATRPDAITLDLELPGVDGRAILHRLWQDGTVGVPVVVVPAATEKLSREDRRRVSSTLRKPFDVPELVRAVNHAVARA